jgi:hypothetical protein
MAAIQPAIEVDACDFPEEIDEYCMDNDIGTHYEGGSETFNLDGSEDDNVFLQWVRKEALKQGLDLEKFKTASGRLNVHVSPT